MRRRAAKMSRHYQKRLFECPVCGFVSPALKRKGTTKPGHIKTMLCVCCGVDTDHVQIE